MGETTSTSDFSSGYGSAAECYRHPGRETNVACSSCGRPICTDCMNPSPVGMRCPDCASERTKVVSAQTIRERSIWQEAPVTTVLIAINVVVFVLGMLLDASGEVRRTFENELVIRGGLFGPSVANGEWYRIVTVGFLHSGFLHVTMNLLALFVLGRLLEPALGSVRFAVLYFVALIAGSLGVMLMDPGQLTVGASGAIFGLLGASVVAVRARGMSLMDTGVGPLLMLNLLITFAIPGISIGGHLGGLVGGFLVGVIVFELEERRNAFGGNRWAAPAVCSVAGVAMFAATVMLARAEYPELVNAVVALVAV